MLRLADLYDRSFSINEADVAACCSYRPLGLGPESAGTSAPVRRARSRPTTPPSLPFSTPPPPQGAGVDVAAGNALVDRLKALNPALGGFSGLYPFGDSYLVAGTDGVGTKLRLAFETGDHATIGQDLVAMSVNDVVVTGAAPMMFLDYFGCGRREGRDALTRAWHRSSGSLRH